MGAAMNRRRAWSWAALAIVAAACTSTAPKPGKVRVGMTKDELVATLGEPLEQSGPAANPNGRTEEVWQYVLKSEVVSGRDVTKGVLTSGVDFFDDPTTGRRYQFVFVDDQLARWGPAPAK